MGQSQRGEGNSESANIRVNIQTAVIKEGLRISAPIVGRLPLVSPDMDLQYKEWTIPAGVSLPPFPPPLPIPPFASTHIHMHIIPIFVPSSDLTSLIADIHIAIPPRRPPQPIHLPLSPNLQSQPLAPLLLLLLHRLLRPSKVNGNSIPPFQQGPEDVYRITVGPLPLPPPHLSFSYSPIPPTSPCIETNSPLHEPLHTSFPPPKPNTLILIHPCPNTHPIHPYSRIS